jgi:nitrogen fixation NifU-like protein
MYSQQVLNHLENPRNAGELTDATATAELENPVCGDVLQLAVRVEEGRIAEVRFKAQGCVPAMACGSLLTTLMEGKPLEELSKITPEKITEAIGGLPEASTHAAQLAVDTLKRLLAEAPG